MGGNQTYDCKCTTRQRWHPPHSCYIFDLILVLNATSSNISAISWRPDLVVEEAGVPGENHRPWASNWYALSLAAASRVHPFCNLQSRARTHALVIYRLTVIYHDVTVRLLLQGITTVNVPHGNDDPPHSCYVQITCSLSWWYGSVVIAGNYDCKCTTRQRWSPSFLLYTDYL
jgi:hypothetical protein